MQKKPKPILFASKNIFEQFVRQKHKHLFGNEGEIIYLGIIIDDKLKLTKYVIEVFNKINKDIELLKRVGYNVSIDSKLKNYIIILLL